MFSHSVMSDSLQPHGLQHARPPCPSLSPGVSHTYVHWVSDAIQPSHPLSPPSPPDFSLSQHQGLFQWVGSLHQVAKILEFRLQHQWIPMSIQGGSPLGLTGLISLLSKRLSGVFSSTTIWKHQFFSAQPSFMIQLSHTWVATGKSLTLIKLTFVGKVISHPLISCLGLS